jgi:hypothetical protein
MNPEQLKKLGAMGYFNNNQSSKIIPVKFHSVWSGGKEHQSTPKTFLDLASGKHHGFGGKLEYNSGEISGLTDVHSENPNYNTISWKHERDDKNKHQTIDWTQDPPKIVPVKYLDVYEYNEDGSFKGIKDYKKYKLHNMGNNKIKDGVKYEPEPPNLEPKIDTTNKVLGTGKDNRAKTFKDREELYSPSGKLLNDTKRSQMEIFRGDELGNVEYYKRKLRRGDSMEMPFLDTDTDNDSQVRQHEGRHRSRAMLEEGITDIPVYVNGKTNIDNLKGQRNSLAEEYPSHTLTFSQDTRNPIKSKNKYDMMDHLGRIRGNKYFKGLPY